MNILVVDDEPLIVRSLARLARAEGFQPTVAHDGLQAWKLFEDSPQTWDMLITDIRMPGLDGLSLARRVRDSGSGVLVVFISGHGQSPDVDALKPAVFLPKPFSRRQLREIMAGSDADA
ncbi:MAG: response regulator [Myxococcota bacterium]